jgi:hypothetical protein
MPAVDIDSPEQYSKALAVLTEVGGTFHGVGQEKKYLLVTEAQYAALVAAGVVKKNQKNGRKERSRGPKKTNRNRKAPGSAGEAED